MNNNHTTNTGSEGDKSTGNVPYYYSNTARGRVAKFFLLRDEENDTFLTEILAGITCFCVTFYIIGLNPLLQNSCDPVSCYSELEFQALYSSTAFATGLSTLLMGIVGGMPVVVSTGVNYSPSFARLGEELHSWRFALSANFYVGCVLLGLSVLVKYLKVTLAIPEDYRVGTSAGIGLLLALIALRASGLVVYGQAGYEPNPNPTFETLIAILSLSTLASLQSKTRIVKRWSYVLTVAGSVCLICVIKASTGTLTLDGTIVFPGPVFAQMEFKADHGRNTTTDDDESFVIAKFVASNLLHKVMDTLSTVTTVVLLGLTSGGSQYNKNAFHHALSKSQKLVRVFWVDALANVVIGPLFGTCILTPFIESVVSVAMGARTGLCSVVTGLLFVLVGFFAIPVSSIITPASTAPILLVGCFTVVQLVKYIDYSKTNYSIPSLLAFVLIAFSQSIGYGVGVSFIILVVTLVLSGNWRVVTPQMVVTFHMCILFVVLSIEDSITSLSGFYGATFGLFSLGIATAALLSHLKVRYPLQYNGKPAGSYVPSSEDDTETMHGGDLLATSSSSGDRSSNMSEHSGSKSLHRRFSSGFSGGEQHQRAEDKVMVTFDDDEDAASRMSNA